MAPHNRLLLEDLAVPYVVLMTSVEEEGTWVRRAEYPELPGCFAESFSAIEALRMADALRVRILVEMRERGEQPPRPRPPLAAGLATMGDVDLDAFLAELLRSSEWDSTGTFE